jgi:hypothetical protein
VLTAAAYGCQARRIRYDPEDPRAASSAVSSGCSGT